MGLARHFGFDQSVFLFTFCQTDEITVARLTRLYYNITIHCFSAQRKGLFAVIATFVNMLAVILGSLLGLCLKRGIPNQAKDTIMQGMGLATVVIGLKMAVSSDNDIIVIISLIIGAIIGECTHLDQKLNNLGLTIKTKLKVKDSNFVDGFVSASLIFCVGAMAIVGSIEAGLTHNYTVIFTKSTLDGIMSIVLASSMGVGVAFSALAILVYQGALTLLAGVLQSVLVDSVITYMTAAGGVLIMGIGLGIANIKDINTINLLPGVFIAGILGWVMLPQNLLILQNIWPF